MYGADIEDVTGAGGTITNVLMRVPSARGSGARGIRRTNRWEFDPS
jgi:hypothetical protein